MENGRHTDSNSQLQLLEDLIEKVNTIQIDINSIKENIKQIEKHTRGNTEVAEKMSRYTAVLDFAENKLTNSGLLSYFTNSATIQDNDETEEPNSDFDE